MKHQVKPLGSQLYGVVAFNGLVHQYFGDSYKEAEDTFYKSHTATHLYKVVGKSKEIIKENLRRLGHPGAMTLAFGK